MDLQGTELVVLSACGSGLGTVSAGEGVYGLRRAFQNAGAQTIVSTLFEVPDKESAEIMQSFYKGLKDNKGKLESLRRAQLTMIRDRRKLEGAAHPFFFSTMLDNVFRFGRTYARPPRFFPHIPRREQLAERDLVKKRKHCVGHKRQED